MILFFFFGLLLFFLLLLAGSQSGGLLLGSFLFRCVVGGNGKLRKLDADAVSSRFDDEGYEEDPYINEDEEPVIADDEDNGDETKETEETI